MNDISRVKIRTDNIPYQHQYDLMDKLMISMSDKFKDETVQQLIRQEINKRKDMGEWDDNLDHSLIESNSAKVAGDTLL
jgi:hypothetical protein